MTMSTPTQGWFDDPQDASSQRWWDGHAWTEHVRPKDSWEQPSHVQSTTGWSQTDSQHSQTPYVSHPPAQAYPPNWYQDPQDPSFQRWWDGDAWTEHVQPNPQASQPWTPASRQGPADSGNPRFARPVGSSPRQAASYPNSYHTNPQPIIGQYSSPTSSKGNKTLVVIAALAAGIVGLIVFVLIAAAVLSSPDSSADDGSTSSADADPTQVSQSSEKVEIGPEGMRFLVDKTVLDKISSECYTFNKALDESLAISDSIVSSPDSGSPSVVDYIRSLEQVFYAYADTLDAVGQLQGEDYYGASVVYTFSDRQPTLDRMRKYATDMGSAREALAPVSTTKQADLALSKLGYKNREGFLKYLDEARSDLVSSMESDSVGMGFAASVIDGCRPLYE